jgi:hypothetical protein
VVVPPFLLPPPDKPASQLKDLVQKTAVGQTITVTVNNQGKSVTKSVTIGQEPNRAVTEPSTGFSF